MAGAGYKLFQTGDVLTAAQVNTYLNEQTVMVFADSAARTTALTSVLAEGMMSYLQDTNAVQVYNGTTWVALGGGGASPLTTKGDLYTFSTVDARLGVGANDTVLTADSSTSTGLKWAAAGGGMTSIASGTLSGASVSLTSIVGTYKDLVLVLRDFYGSAEDSVKFRYNNDTNNNRYIQAATSGNNVSFNDDAHRFCTASVDNTTSNAISIVEIYDYANTTHWKSHRVLTYTNNATTTTNYDSFISAGVYNQDTAITRLDIFPTSGTFTAGTYVLYGVK